MICIPFDWKFSSESNGMHLEVIRGHLKGQKRSFGVKNWNYGQMHMICIPFDWKFSSESNGMHLEVIQGHLRGPKRSFWGRKSEIWPNAPDTYTNRLRIWSRTRIQGYLRSIKFIKSQIRIKLGQEQWLQLTTNDRFIALDSNTQHIVNRYAKRIQSQFAW